MPRTTTGRVICARCRHPRLLHSNGETECKARGCHSGTDGGPCQAFVAEIVPAAAEQAAALTPQFVAPDFDQMARASGQ